MTPFHDHVLFLLNNIMQTLRAEIKFYLPIPKIKSISEN